MVTAGTKHFKGNLEQVGNQDSAQSIYEALRLYNSGSINYDVSDPYSQLLRPTFLTCEQNLSDGKGATDSYVSDIANRLQGRTN
jgi:hypothetical protein